VDRRFVFFLIGAVVCFALTPVALPEHRYVAMAASGVYLLLAILSALEAVSRTRR
jgi:hypothetical protein